MSALPGTARPRRTVPETIQTSTMDCGPAALKSVPEGFGIRASHGRLREACQTDVDGTPIDAIEAVANRLGVAAEQRMVPADHLFAAGLDLLPARLVLRQPGGDTHFVVAWRQAGQRVPVMDPATGRRWVPVATLRAALHRHQQSVPAAAWRDWAGDAEFRAPRGHGLARLGLRPRAAETLIGAALSDPHWFPAAALEASIRLALILGAGAGCLRARRWHWSPASSTRPAPAPTTFTR